MASLLNNTNLTNIFQKTEKEGTLSSSLYEASITFIPKHKKNILKGAWVAQLVKHLPSVQVMIPGSWDQAPHWAPCSVGSLLLPLPLPHAHALSLK